MEDNDPPRTARKWIEGLSKGAVGHGLETLNLKGLQAIHVEKGLIHCDLVVPDCVSDKDGNWHVGAISILIDDVGAAAIFSFAGHAKASVDFSVSFYSTAKIQEEVEIEAKVVGKQGRLSSVVVEIRRKSNGELIALGKQWMSPATIIPSNLGTGPCLYHGIESGESLAMAYARKHTALLVIDMQKDFVEDDGLMRVDGGKAIVPSVIKAVEVARELGILVVWVVREHDSLGRDVELFRRHFYGPGKVGPTSKGSAGAELVDGLMIKEGDYKLVKTRFSAFFATHLHSFLQSNRITSVVIVGVQTPNCIRQTVFDAVALDYQSVTVIVDATAAATPEIHFANIRDMQNVGVATPTLQEWLDTNA